MFFAMRTFFVLWLEQGGVVVVVVDNVVGTYFRLFMVGWNDNVVSAVFVFVFVRLVGSLGTNQPTTVFVRTTPRGRG